MSISFLNPYFLLLIAGLPLLWVMARRPVDRWQLLLRGLIFLVLIFALSRPLLIRSGDEAYNVFIVDLSASMSASQATTAVERAKILAAQTPQQDVNRLIAIVGQAHKDAADQLQEAVVIPADDSTPLVAGLKEALDMIPLGASGTVTLITDGAGTDRHWADTLQSLQQRRITVHSMIIGGGDKQDIFPSDIRLDGPVRVGQTAKVDVTVVGTGADLQVALYSGARQLAISSPFTADSSMVVSLFIEPETEGAMPLEARLMIPEGETDTEQGNNSIAGLFAVDGPLSVLYLGVRENGGKEKLQTLLGKGFKVEDEGRRALNADFPFENFDLAVVDDRPAETLPEAFQKAMKIAVRERGLGLFYAGGKGAFGDGGYQDTPLAELLPIEFEQKDQKKDPSVSLAIVIDTSGSMMGRPIEIAKHVAKLAISRLKPHDMVGVVEFYGNKHWAVPLQSAANKVEIDRAISRMQASGSTILYPAVEEAYYGLKNMKTKFKHLLILIDGDMGGENYEPLVRRMAKDGITVSTVLTGYSLHHQEMFDVANWGKGRFYTIGNRFSLVDLMLKKERVTKQQAYKPGDYGVKSLTGPGWLGDTDLATLPRLAGYVEVKARPGSELLLTEEEKDYPLLASWRNGLGRVTVMTTEPMGQGTRDWAAWPGYGKMLARVLSRTASDATPFHYSVEREKQAVTIVAHRTMADRDYVPSATITGLKQSSKELPFRQRSPDRFEARFFMPEGEDILLETAALPGVSGEGVALYQRYLVSAGGGDQMRELQVNPRAALDLNRLAKATGGALLDVSVDHLPPRGLRTEAASLQADKAWPYLLLLAILLYFLELIYRRWPAVSWSNRHEG